MIGPGPLLALALQLAASASVAASERRPPEAKPDSARHRTAPDKEEAGKDVAALTLEQLGAEFRRFRSGKGSGEGAEVWGGRKHALMQELVRRLGDARTSRAKALAILGKPDDETSPGRANWWGQRSANGAPPEKSEGPSTVIMYQWRGWHDFAYFEIQHGKVREAGWWMAGE